MALKDWKKDERFTSAWVDKKTLDICNVYQGYDGEWMINISSRFGTQKVLRPFRSKTRAIAYAKSYMEAN